MPEYLSPGVYVEEISGGARPIEGVSTSTAGFLGATERGPEVPRLITSFLEFQRWYGGYISTVSYLAYAVQGFFDNGGQRCFIGRIVSDDAVAATGTIAGNGGNLTVAATGRGTWGNAITMSVEPATQSGRPGRGEWVKITIDYPGVQEVYDDLTHTPGASNNVVTILNTASRLVKVWWDSVPVALTSGGPTQLTNGSETAVAVSHYTGNLDPIWVDPAVPANGPPDEQLGRGRGFEAMDAVDEVSLMIAPDEVRDNFRPITTDMINRCTNLGDRFAIVSSLQTDSDPNALGPPEDTTFAAFYHPWIRVFDPSANDTILIPATGHIAGVYARTDIERGVHKAPANAVLRGVIEMAQPITKGVQDILNPKNVNCIRDFRSDGRGIRVWGARTMSSDPEWKYVNVRRLFLFVEESIDEGTQWVVFEPNDEPTWARVRRSLASFLISVWRSGALMGATQDEAFFVKCDRTTMTQDDIDNGRLICYIGIAPVKPAEFVIFRISQKTMEAAG